MKKKLYITLGVIAGLLIAAYLVVIFFVGSIVTSAVNHFGPEYAKTDVKLTAAHISPLSGEGTLDGLSVGNPPGWSSGNAFSLKRIHVKVEPSSLFSDHVIIDEVEIDRPEFAYETRLVSSNIGQLLKNLQKEQGNSGADVKSQKTGEPLKFEIKHLVIKDGKMTLAVAGRAAVPIPMPTVEFHDLGTAQGGVTSSQLTALVGDMLLTTVVQDAANEIGKLGGAATGTAGTVIKNADGILQGILHH